MCLSSCHFSIMWCFLCEHREREREKLLLLIRTLILLSHLTLTISLETPSPNVVKLGVSSLVYTLHEMQNIWSLTVFQLKRGPQKKWVSKIIKAKVNTLHQKTGDFAFLATKNEKHALIINLFINWTPCIIQPQEI